MKIEIEIPDWCAERNIYVVAGIELAAYKNATESIFHIKTVRCNQCGECCKNLPLNNQMDLLSNGDCSSLVPDGEKLICRKGAYRGFNCCVSDPIMGKQIGTNCIIRYDV